jgi:hypothetical protein
MKTGNMEIIGASKEDQALLRARGEFAKKYCESKGWSVDPEKLSFEQIIEIRSQDGWKQPKV